MPNIDRKDVQGLLRTSYPKARHAAYHLLEIVDGKAAKAWLAGLIKSITFADKEHPSTEHLNIAFTAAGLEKLGLPHDAMQTFPGVFREGMPLDHRAGILGDVGPSAPQNWDWGGTSGDAHAGRLHVLLLAFAHSGAGLATLNANLAGGFGTAVVALPGSPLATRTFDSDNNYEHFGFRDGISQPLVEGINDEAAKENATSYSSVVEARRIRPRLQELAKPAGAFTVGRGRSGSIGYPQAPGARHAQTAGLWPQLELPCVPPACAGRARVLELCPCRQPYRHRQDPRCLRTARGEAGRPLVQWNVTGQGLGETRSRARH